MGMPGGKWDNETPCLWIAGLPTDCTDFDLYEVFAPFGAIPPQGVKAMKDADGIGTGIGFVNYLDPSHAQLAIRSLNGATGRDGTSIKVAMKTKAKPKPN